VSEFRCKISEGVAGLVTAVWGADSRQVATFADFNVHLTLWSLTDQSTLVVPRPKDPSAALAWGPSCGELVAVATRTGSKDAIQVLQASQGWASQAFWSPATLDLAALAWSPDGGALVVQDTCLRYLVLVYTPRGELLSKLNCYEHALGVRSLSFAPCGLDHSGASSSGLLLAVASFDQAVRLVNGLTWQATTEYAHTHPKLVPPHAQCRNLQLLTQTDDGSFVAASSADDFPLPAVAVDDTKLVPRIGIGLMGWSHDGRFLATRNDNTPHALWVWDVSSTGLLAVLVLTQPVRALAWAPQEHLLAAVAGADVGVVFWSPAEGARSRGVASLVQLSALEWAADGGTLLVAGQLDPAGPTSARQAACCMVPRRHAGFA
jgi:WD40 repeat protein